MFSLYFIERPVFAKVLSIFIVIVGLIGLKFLPIAQYPEMTPPMVSVISTYTGGSAEVVENSVTRPLENQINGVKGMLYMTSTSASDGSSTINVYFESGYDLDIASVDVQNSVNIALAQLPVEVKNMGVSTVKKSPQMVEVVSVTSSNDSRSSLFLSNFAALNVVDELKRIEGVGSVQIFGELKYAIRVWLNAEKLASLNLTPMDISDAIKKQNIQVALGNIGKSPAQQDVTTEYTLTALTQFSEVNQFKNIIVLSSSDGTIVRLKDIARVELGAENYASFTKRNNINTSNIGIYQLPTANAIQIADDVKAKLQELSKRFPDDIQVETTYDTTEFVRVTIDDVVKTLIEAILLVIFVVFIFLQSWRATVIPAIAIPVSLVGTFGVLLAIGFSINFLTLFGLILAIGIVVDDSIIVVENVERNVIENPDAPLKEASIKAMKELTSPIVATTLVLMAVFIPVSFIPGISGTMYQQFAITIVISVIISAINALTLSPVLANMMLRKEEIVNDEKLLPFRLFNRGFDAFKHYFEIALKATIKHWYVPLVLFFMGLGATYFLFTKLPTGFIPNEDQGKLFVALDMRPGSALRLNEVLSDDVTDAIMNTPGVENVITIGGLNILTGALDSSSSSFFVILEDWDVRYPKGQDAVSIIKAIKHNVEPFDNANINVFNMPAIPGMSPVGGFEMQLQNYTSGSVTKFQEYADTIVAEAMKDPRIMYASTTFKAEYPQLYIDLDRDKIKTLDLDINDVFSSLQIYLGSIYVNDFQKFGKVYRVFVQAESDDRAQKNDITKIFVRNKNGGMVPLSAVAKIKRTAGPSALTHYNMYRSITIRGVHNIHGGYSSSEAMVAMQEIADRVLPKGEYGYEWSGMSQQEISAGNAALYIFLLSVLFAFLFLAANYESWIMSFIILMPIPVVMLGSLLGTMSAHLINNTYVQIGMVLLVGMSAKNAILVVEFAKELHEAGHTIVDAAIDATVIRLRPILMTIFAFLLGVLPLVLATGAGAAARNSIGTGVFWGMVASTILTLFFTPVLFVLAERLKVYFSKTDS